MRVIIYCLLLTLTLTSTGCKSIKEVNNASAVNDQINEQLFALKGYQPIDPISVDQSTVTNDSIIEYFPNEATRIAVGKVTRNGSLSFGSNGITHKGESYTVIIDYIKYHTTSIPALYSFAQKYDADKIYRSERFKTMFGQINNDKKLKSGEVVDSIFSENLNDQKIKIPVYVGVGLRIQANIVVLKDSLNINLASLYNLGLAASQNQINGTLIVQTLGISGKQISSAIPIPDKINESTIQNAITSLATIKSKLYDSETNIKPQIVGFGLSFNIEGAKDLIEATLHSTPLKVKKKEKHNLIFEDILWDN